MVSSPLEIAATSRGRTEHTGVSGCVGDNSGQFSSREPDAIDTSSDEIGCIREPQGLSAGVRSVDGQDRKSAPRHEIKRNRHTPGLDWAEARRQNREYLAREEALVAANCLSIVKMCREQDSRRHSSKPLTEAQREQLGAAQWHEGAAYRLRRQGRSAEADEHTAKALALRAGVDVAERLGCTPEQWAARVLAEAAEAPAAGGSPEEAIESHIYERWAEAGFFACLAEAVANATQGAVVLVREVEPQLDPKPF